MLYILHTWHLAYLLPCMFVLMTSYSKQHRT